MKSILFRYIKNIICLCLSPRFRQYGGTLTGFIAGVLIALFATLAVAIYVNHVNISFVPSKMQNQVVQADDAIEQLRNQHWNPNEALQHDTDVNLADELSENQDKSSESQDANNGLIGVEKNDDDLLNKFVNSRKVAPVEATEQFSERTQNPLDNGGNDHVLPEKRLWFIQVGAFKQLEDAQAQLNKLSSLGLNPKISKIVVQDAVGKTSIFRVRIGPYNVRQEAEMIQIQLDKNNTPSLLIQVKHDKQSS